ncbi:Uncharacterised protein [Mycobacteroides abscessus subsp. abscessus]|nr:Uncharacterised protein [Mycobacteroides abscessus subsp. abscessus]
MSWLRTHCFSVFVRASSTSITRKLVMNGPSRAVSEEK